MFATQTQLNSPNRRANQLRDRNRDSGSAMSMGEDVQSSVYFSSTRPDSDCQKIDQRETTMSPLDWRESSRVLSQLTNSNIDVQLRNKVIHKYARRQFDQNTTSDEQLRSFKIVQQMQRQKGGVSPEQSRKYGTFIKAMSPLGVTIGGSSSPDEQRGFARTLASSISKQTSGQPMRASTQLQKLNYDFSPVMIDNSQPVEDNDNEDKIALDSVRKKMFREKSPKQKYFDQLTTQGYTNADLRDVNQKHDMIQQLQEKLSQMKTKMGRGGKLNNQKNMSAIRCQADTYQKPYPKIVKARHMQLSLGSDAILRADEQDAVGTPKSPSSRRQQHNLTSLQHANSASEDTNATNLPAKKNAKITNNEASRNATIAQQQFSKVLSKQPRRVINKSYDFSKIQRQPTLDNSRPVNEETGMMNQTAYSQVGSRFTGNQAAKLQLGQHNNSSPPRMLCYKPRMAESNMISSLERFVTNDALRSSMRGQALKQTKHSMRPRQGFNDVSRFTWSTVQPEASELPPHMAKSLNDASRLSHKGVQDGRTWQQHRETPAECIGGPKQTFADYERKRDRQHSELVQNIMNRKMLTLRDYSLKYTK